MRGPTRLSADSTSTSSLQERLEDLFILHRLSEGELLVGVKECLESQIILQLHEKI